MPSEEYGSVSELGREIDRLWAKVAGSSPEPEASALAPILGSAVGVEAAGREAAWETVSLLKRRHQRQVDSWAEMLEAKERALQALKERQSLMERELRELRGKAQTHESWVVQATLDAQSKIDSAARALHAERARHDEEQKALKKLIEQIRRRLSDEENRFEEERAVWENKERGHIEGLSELRALSSRDQEQSAKSSEEIRRLSESLNEAKGALEKALSELLSERRLREEAERERAEARSRLEQLSRRWDEVSKLWEEERARWDLSRERESASSAPEEPRQAPEAESPVEEEAAQVEAIEAAQEPILEEVQTPRESAGPSREPLWPHVVAWLVAAAASFLLLRFLNVP